MHPARELRVLLLALLVTHVVAVVGRPGWRDFLGMASVS